MNRFKRITLLTAIGLSGFSIYHTFNNNNIFEITPITGRKKFILLSKKFENILGKESYNNLILKYNKKQLIDKNHPASKTIHRVVNRLLKGINEYENINNFKLKKITIIRSSEENAMAMPGGYLVIYTGILKYLDTEDKLAFVLGHEIGHVLARHSAEQITKNNIFSILLLLLLGGQIPIELSRIGIQMMNLSYSRKHELEADEIGIKLMTKACFNPNDSYKSMEQFTHNDSKQLKIMNYFSTHPNSNDRIDKLKQFANDLHMEYDNCQLKRNEYYNI